MNHDFSEEIASLFDANNPLLPFALDSVSKIPEYGSILYAIFLDEKEFIYIGIGGIAGTTARSRDPRSRIREHTSGRRSGDQFCIYIQDFYVIPTLIQSADYEPAKGVLDKLTRDYIHQNLSYRFVSFQSDDSDVIVRSLEKQIQSGVLGLTPILNGIGK